MSDWNDERYETARTMWQDGHSASQIAAKLGGVTRNAVLGVLHRKGWAKRSKGALPGTRQPSMSRAQIQARRKKEATKKAAAGPKPAPKGNAALRELLASLPVDHVDRGEELVIPLAERKTVLTLERGDCRWPIGDPQNDEFHFCGKAKVAGIPYCEFHARRAFQPPKVANRAAQPAGGRLALPAPVAAPETDLAAGGAPEMEDA